MKHSASVTLKLMAEILNRPLAELLNQIHQKQEQLSGLDSFIYKGKAYIKNAKQYHILHKSLYDEMAEYMLLKQQYEEDYLRLYKFLKDKDYNSLSKYLPKPLVIGLYNVPVHNHIDKPEYYAEVSDILAKIMLLNNL